MSRKPSSTYSRMFSAFAAGTYLVVTGAIGYDINRMHGNFEGGRWVDGPVWWQVALGTAFLLLGIYWSRRLESGWTFVQMPRRRVIKNVGSGRTVDAAHGEPWRSASPGEPKA